jgi:hypothetical protein
LQKKRGMAEKLTDEYGDRAVSTRRKRTVPIDRPIRKQCRNPCQKQALRDEPMHDPRRDIEWDAISQRQRDEVAGALDARGLGDAQRLADLVHAAELELDQEAAQHGVVEDVQDGEDQLRQVGNQYVGDEPVRVGAWQPENHVGIGRERAKAHVPQVGHAGADFAVAEARVRNS